MGCVRCEIERRLSPSISRTRLSMPGRCLVRASPSCCLLGPKPIGYVGPSQPCRTAFAGRPHVETIFEYPWGGLYILIQRSNAIPDRVLSPFEQAPDRAYRASPNQSLVPESGLCGS